ncbi:pirin family protein [Actinokineospora enzanensis]|uniref:pirin family protein n=1 Tax=Actinokineospora enzanensis TaxID=155975 RepID=UPI00036927BA|nr:pirin family protein [Actinokineospora enzanensis]
MSNTDPAPGEHHCRPTPGTTPEVLHARAVPLGGPRAIRVHRTLPQRTRSLIGAWCFADHYGPERALGMDVAPHPHTGLQTVSWLFEGEIEHRDSLGTHALVRPGEVNLMTGGAGICHSETSTAASPVLHGVQLWVALPDADRHTARAFEHFAPEPVELPGASLRVFLGNLAGTASPVRTFTPLLGAELTLAPHSRRTLDIDPAFEHGVLLDTGRVAVAGTDLAPTDLGYICPGRTTLDLTNRTDAPARMLLLGGPPFPEPILMWWNFVARTHEEIASYRAEWEAGSARFGQVTGYPGTPARLPAPPIPPVRIKPRHNP